MDFLIKLRFIKSINIWFWISSFGEFSFSFYTLSIHNHMNCSAFIAKSAVPLLNSLNISSSRMHRQLGAWTLSGRCWWYRLLCLSFPPYSLSLPLSLSAIAINSRNFRNFECKYSSFYLQLYKLVWKVFYMHRRILAHTHTIITILAKHCRNISISKWFASIQKLYI